MLLTVQSEEYYRQWQQMPYDSDTWQISKAQKRHKARKQIHTFIKENCTSILDCGCGIAYDYEFYRDNGVRYEGMDVTPKFVEAAQKRGAPVRQGDIRKLPFPDKSFDAVYCKDVLIHLLFDDWKKALDEMHRVARKYIITLEPAWAPETFYSVQEVHSTKPQEGKMPAVLMFFHNVYGIKDVMMWAAQKGLQVQKWTGRDPERTAWSGALARWQITIFTKHRGGGL